MVREFQRIISTEARAQVLDRYGRLPDAVLACVGGGSNAMGVFADFIPDESVQLIGFEAAGDGVETGRHAATITEGREGVLHGMRTYVLQDDDGQTKESHSISAGLDYPGVGPEHAWLRLDRQGHVRAGHRRGGHGGAQAAHADRRHHARHRERHALAGAMRVGRRIAETDPSARPLFIVNLSGRGDKDVDTAMTWFGLDGKPDATTGGKA